MLSAAKQMKSWVARGSQLGYVASPTQYTPTKLLEDQRDVSSTPRIIVKMANRGYDVVVDIDQEVFRSSLGQHNDS